MAGMASFGKTMTDQQIRDLATFLQKGRGITPAGYAKLVTK
jgi:hypothetical protein